MGFVANTPEMSQKRVLIFKFGNFVANSILFQANQYFMSETISMALYCLGMTL